MYVVVTVSVVVLVVLTSCCGGEMSILKCCGLRLLSLILACCVICGLVAFILLGCIVVLVGVVITVFGKCTGLGVGLGLALVGGCCLGRCAGPVWVLACTFVTWSSECVSVGLQKKHFSVSDGDVGT